MWRARRGCRQLLGRRPEFRVPRPEFVGASAESVLSRDASALFRVISRPVQLFFFGITLIPGDASPAGGVPIGLLNRPERTLPDSDPKVCWRSVSGKRSGLM